MDLQTLDQELKAWSGFTGVECKKKFPGMIWGGRQHEKRRIDGHSVEVDYHGISFIHGWMSMYIFDTVKIKLGFTACFWIWSIWCHAHETRVFQPPFLYDLLARMTATEKCPCYSIKRYLSSDWKVLRIFHQNSKFYSSKFANLYLFHNPGNKT